MAYDRWTEECHLTPGGWVKGTTTYFGKPSSREVPRPEDTVETWITEAYQRSGYGREEASHRRVWYDASKTEVERKRLRAQFPSPFPPYSREE